MSDDDSQEAKGEILKDSLLETVMGYAQEQWPEGGMTKAGAKRYYQFNDDLYVQDNLVIRGHPVVTPEKMRQKVSREHS